MKLTEKERKRLYDFAIKIGFIIDNVPESKKARIKYYLEEGYRIRLDNQKKPEVINLKGLTIGIEIEQDILDLYSWLIKENIE